MVETNVEIWNGGGRDPEVPVNQRFRKIEVFINDPMPNLGDLDPTQMRFAKNGWYNAYTQSAAVTFTIISAIPDGVCQTLKFTSNGTNNVTFGTGFDSSALFNVTSGSPLGAGTYWFYMMSIDSKVHVHVKAAT